MSRSSQFKAVGLAFSIFWLTTACNFVEAQSVVPTYYNGWIRFASGPSPGNFNYGSFTYDNSGSQLTVTASTLGKFNAFVLDDPNFNGGGTGYNSINNLNAPYDQLVGVPGEPINFSITDSNGVTAFDALDRGSFGGNFNPNEYVIEVLYKPGPNNTSTSFNVMLEQWDGFEQNTGSANFGKRKAEQLQWGSFQSGVVPDPGGINAYHANGLQDADGFVSLRIPVSVAPQFTGQSYLFAGGTTSYAVPGDGMADLNAFQDRVPNGFGQVHLQAPFNDLGQRLEIEVKDVRIVPALRNPTVVARFDAKSGIGRRFGTPFSEDNGGGEYLLFDHDNDGSAVTPDLAIRETDQVQRFDANGFTNLIIKTDDDTSLGGVGMWQDHIYQTFDGTAATLNVKAKLTAHNTANTLQVVLNDLDGQDGAAGQGGEEYKYDIALNQFNLSTFSTVSIPLSGFTSRQQAFETVNDGDTLLTDFNLYYLGLVTEELGGLVGLEIESIQVNVAAAASGDFDQDGDVDGRDFLVWQRNVGKNNGVRAVLDGGDADYDGDVDAADLAVWQAQYNGGNLTAASTSVPEPSCITLLLAMAGLGGICRRTAR